jgi:hypothetical protein
MRSLCFMWIGLVAMNVCTRPRLAPLIASPARATSLSLARASEHTVESFTAAATARIASKSPGLEAAKPASITSTRRRSSCLPIRTFSSLFMAAPGLCSPSRIVVSKMINASCMGFSKVWMDSSAPPAGAAVCCAKIGGWGF